jgi:hypothetical protein
MIETMRAFAALAVGGAELFERHSHGSLLFALASA